jgi:hypothetical protein
LTYDDYFNYDEEGNDMRPGNHQEDWNDPNLEANHFQCRAIHIEDLRHYIELEQYFFKETWETNKEITQSDLWNDSVAVSCSGTPLGQSKTHASVFKFFTADHYWYGGLITNPQPICGGNLSAAGNNKPLPYGFEGPEGSASASCIYNFLRNNKINFSAYCYSDLNNIKGIFSSSSQAQIDFYSKGWLQVPKHFKFKIKGIQINNFNRITSIDGGSTLFVKIGLKIISPGPTNEHFIYLLKWDNYEYIDNTGSPIYISDTMTNLASAGYYNCIINIASRITVSCYANNPGSRNSLGEINGLSFDDIILIDAD